MIFTPPVPPASEPVPPKLEVPLPDSLPPSPGPGPAVPVLEMPPIAAGPVDEIGPAIDDCAARLEAMQADACHTIGDALHSCQASLDDMTSRVIGQLESRVTALEGALTKPAAKCMNQLQGSMSQCYSTAMNLGLPIPSQEQIVTGLQSGKFLESLQEPDQCPHPQPACIPICAPVQPPYVPQPSPPYVPQPVSTGPSSGPAPPSPSPSPEQPPEVTVNAPVTVEVPPVPPELQSMLEQITQMIGFLIGGYQAGGANGEAPVTVSNWVGSQIFKVFGVPISVNASPKAAATGGTATATATAGNVTVDINAPEFKKDQTGQPMFDLFGAQDWSNPAICAAIAKYIASIPDNGGLLSERLGFKKIGDDEWQDPEWFSHATDGVWGPIRHFFRAVIVIFLDLTGDISSIIPVPPGCDRIGVRALEIVLGIAGIITRWTGWNLQKTIQPFLNTRNYICPTDIPYTSEAQRAYLNGTIDEDTMACLARANNDIDSWVKMFTYGERTRPNVMELVRLNARNKLTPDDYVNRMRQSGILNPTDKLLYEELFRWVPGPSDLVRFMVRDVFDEPLQARIGGDEQFTEKWTGPASAWGRAQGVDDETMKMFWRAHWQLPSPTQLYEMLHRLRPGRVDPDLVVTIDDVRKALQQDDHHPYWIEALIAISYRPITRLDVYKLMDHGLAGDNEAVQKFMDFGYTQEDATSLMKARRAYTAAQKQKALGLPDAKEWRKDFISWNATEQEYSDFLFSQNYSPPEVATAVETAKLERKQAARKLAIVNVRKQFETAGITREQALAILLSLGLDVEEAQELVSVWVQTHKTKSKQASAAQVCKWRSMKLITPDDQLKRLVAMGWSLSDASRIVLECGDSISQKAAAEAAKLEKQAQAAAKQAAKDAAAAKKEENKQRKAAGLPPLP